MEQKREAGGSPRCSLFALFLSPPHQDDAIDRKKTNLRVQVHVVLRRELSLVLVLQDALELMNAPLHERPACIESDRRPFRHLALLLFLLGLLGLGRHFGSRGRARVETETETEGESA